MFTREGLNINKIERFTPPFCVGPIGCVTPNEVSTCRVFGLRKSRPNVERGVTQLIEFYTKVYGDY